MQASSEASSQVDLRATLFRVWNKGVLGGLLFLFGWRTYIWLSLTSADVSFLDAFDWTAFDTVADRWVAGEEIYVPLSTEETLPWLYPPIMALLFLPLSSLGTLPSWIAIAGVMTIAFFVSLRLMSKEFQVSFGLALVLGLALIMPSSSILMGQLTMLALLVFVVAMRQQGAGNSFASGLVLSLLVLKPPLLVMIWPVMFLKGTANRITGFAIGASLLVGINIFLFPEQSLSFVESSRRMAALQSQPGAIPFEKMANVFGFLVDPIGLSPGGLLTQGITVAISGSVASYVAYAIYRRGRTDWQLAFALGAAMLPIVTPRLYWYDAALLIVPTILLASRSKGKTTLIALLSAAGSLASGVIWSLNILFVIAGGLLIWFLLNTRSQAGHLEFSDLGKFSKTVRNRFKAERGWSF